MEVFISWSGSRSRAIASALHEWLPNVIQSVEPFVSHENIAKGKRWNAELTVRLEACQFAVVCLTPTNLDSPWLHFEAGAVSLNGARVCCLLDGVKTSEVGPPLADFQLTVLGDDAELLRLVKSINDGCGDRGLKSEMLEAAFARWLDRLRDALSSIPPDTAERPLPRSSDDFQEEVLRGVRSLLAGTSTEALVAEAAVVRTAMDAIIEHARLAAEGVDDGADQLAKLGGDHQARYGWDQLQAAIAEIQQVETISHEILRRAIRVIRGQAHLNM